MVIPPLANILCIRQKNVLKVLEEEIYLISHHRKSILYLTNEICVKSNTSDDNFDVTLGDCDRALVHDTILILLVNKFNRFVDHGCLCLYENDTLTY